MIVTVTLNPAWDVTYPMGALRPGQTHRVGEASGRAGGKGINVSRVLHQLGHPTLAVGLYGGEPGRAVHEDLARSGTPYHLVDGGPIARTRTTVTLVETGGRATVLCEPGPAADSIDWAAVRESVVDLLDCARVLVLSGSLPPAVPLDAYAELTTAARARGVPVVVDAEGPALMASLAARPDVVKPNRDELREATGLDDPGEGAAALRRAGAGAVVVSLGPDGMLADVGGQVWLARPPAIRVANPTGAGDAAVAAVAAGLAGGADWPTILRAAVAWSAAAVCEPVAGVVSSERATELAALVEIAADPHRPLDERTPQTC
ncbi:1-phosphofructokinase family hexose kinase [Nocardioides panacihumi]|uniref:1-phosphofructokinase family hexose kinase n=1 Tax=Nocardioides panacihumi TaxID=400774 RepID=A0ABN2RL81_9ACTN